MKRLFAVLILLITGIFLLLGVGGAPDGETTEDPGASAPEPSLEESAPAPQGGETESAIDGEPAQPVMAPPPQEEEKKLRILSPASVINLSLFAIIVAGLAILSGRRPKPTSKTKVKTEK